jgi:eukaryotic-like serine/threonine-protein kinase
MKKISPDRWRKIEALMDLALEVSASEREDLVRKEAKDDVDLAEQVLKLLAASDESSEFMEAADSRSQLEGVLAKMARSVEENESEPEALTKVGPYQIVRQLGRGGMGQVYLAVRDDEAFKRYVALKIIRRGMDSEDIRVRFRTERRILASLTHPNIARLLDGGSTDDGQAYFVMDYVDGEPIDVYCDKHKLSLKQRLELFEKVASAVHYAHQNLIVHRDLKPGNILVTEDGTVKLLDFGIAKFLNPDMAGYTVPMTKTEVRVMTPEYASPEQVRGEVVTTASDVYQLGILLYELLTGHRPFSFETRARGEIEKIILEQAPEKPSTMIAKTETLPQSSVSPSSVSRQRGTPLERLRKQLSGDLDRIVLMALRKEIDRRYQSADQLLKDLQNYRAGRPVSAQADTFRYRATRFVQRNKLGVAAGSIAVLALVLITGISIRYATITAQQRDQIEIEAKKAGQVRDYLLDLFEQANPEFNSGIEPTAHDLLRRGSENILERLTDQPAVQSELLYTIGLVSAELGYFDEARPLLERSLEIEQQLAGDGISSGLAQSFYGLGYLEDEIGKETTAIALLQRSLDIRMVLFGDRDVRTAESLNDLAAAMYNSKAYPVDSVMALWNRALDVRRELLPTDHKDIIETLANVGNAYAEQGDFELAEATFKQAREMAERSLSTNHPFYASIAYGYGTTLYDLERYAEAETLLRDALASRIRIYGPESDPVANTMNWLARVLFKKGQLQEAEQYFIDSKNLHAKIFGSDSWFVARDLNIIGRFYEQTSRHREAKQAFAEAYLFAQISAPPFSTTTFSIAQSLARLQMLDNEFLSASKLLEELITTFIEDWGENDTDIASAQLKLGACYVELNSMEAAAIQLERARSVFGQTPSEFKDELAEIEALIDRAQN